MDCSVLVACGPNLRAPCGFAPLAALGGRTVQRASASGANLARLELKRIVNIVVADTRPPATGSRRRAKLRLSSRVSTRAPGPINTEVLMNLRRLPGGSLYARFAIRLALALAC